MSTREHEDDAQLVTAVRAGDGRAASWLWRRHAPMVLRMLRRNLGSSGDVEDVAQEVFLVVFHGLGGLRNPASLRAFIAAVTVRACLHQRRRQRHRQETSASEWATSERDSVAREAEARIALARLLAVLCRLRPADRVATMLRCLERREVGDIASALDLSIATVKRRIARGSAKVALLAERDPFLAQYSGTWSRRTASRIP